MISLRNLGKMEILKRVHELFLNKFYMAIKNKFPVGILFLFFLIFFVNYSFRSSLINENLNLEFFK